MSDQASSVIRICSKTLWALAVTLLVAAWTAYFVGRVPLATMLAITGAPIPALAGSMTARERHEKNARLIRLAAAGLPVTEDRRAQLRAVRGSP